MKTITLVIIISMGILLLFTAAQAFVMNSSRNIETHRYEVLKKYENYEIREYEAANFSAVVIPARTYEASSRMGFRSLAGYIFGGNSENEKIAMTSPVAMDISDSVTMKFMIPSEYEIDDLPRPNSSEIKFVHEPAKKVAAIQFGGWANDKKIEEYSKTLDSLLSMNGYTHTGDFTYLGYNPPYEIVNRRNEVIVELVEN